MEKLKLNIIFINKKLDEKGWTYTDLAHKMGVTPAWVSLLIKRAVEGNGLNLATLATLAEALECEQKDLLI
jgi:DNA-binding Xre family transcriptional regulator